MLLKIALTSEQSVLVPTFLRVLELQEDRRGGGEDREDGEGEGKEGLRCGG
jgi:hypothetical protein